MRSVGMQLRSQPLARFIDIAGRPFRFIAPVATSPGTALRRRGTEVNVKPTIRCAYSAALCALLAHRFGGPLSKNGRAFNCLPPPAL